MGDARGQRPGPRLPEGEPLTDEARRLIAAALALRAAQRVLTDAANDHGPRRAAAYARAEAAFGDAAERLYAEADAFAAFLECEREGRAGAYREARESRLVEAARQEARTWRDEAERVREEHALDRARIAGLTAQVRRLESAIWHDLPAAGAPRDQRDARIWEARRAFLRAEERAIATEMGKDENGEDE